MPLQPHALTRKIKDILQHIQPLLKEASSPILHFRRTVVDIWGTLEYVSRLIGEKNRVQSIADRHLGRLYGMALVNLIEALERFFKGIRSRGQNAVFKLFSHI